MINICKYLLEICVWLQWPSKIYIYWQKIPSPYADRKLSSGWKKQVVGGRLAPSMLVKGIIHPKTIILLSFTHPHGVEKLYNDLSCGIQNNILWKMFSFLGGPYNGNNWIVWTTTFFKYIFLRVLQNKVKHDDPFKTDHKSIIWGPRILIKKLN